MTTAIFRRFSKRARDYICAYQALKDNITHKDLDITEDKDKATLTKIEKNVLSVKITH